MNNPIISACFVVLLVAISSPTTVSGQNLDSLIYLLDNKLIDDDAERYKLLCKIISQPEYFERKIEYCNQAIVLAENLNIKPSQPYVCKGIVYLNYGDLDPALDCFFTAAKYFKEDSRHVDVAMAYQYIGETYNLQKDPDNAKSYFNQAIKIYKQEEDSVMLAVAILNLGYANYSMGQYDTALAQTSMAQDLFQDLGYEAETQEIAYCLGNTGLVLSKQSVFIEAEDYLLSALEILKDYNDQRALADYTIEYTRILQHKGETSKAIEFAYNRFAMARSKHLREYARDAAQALANLYKATSRYDSALYYQLLFMNLNDSIIDIRTIQKMANRRTEFEIAESKAERDLLKKEKTIQLITNILLGIILVMTIGLVVFYYYSLKRSKLLTAELEERKILLETKSSELQEKNNKINSANEELTQLYELANEQKEAIVSSINYAQRIQNAILPPETYITELINENFIFYKPKDIVSGDFYWIKQVNQYIILVSADCTGHGVPGALMSMLGISCLKDIVQRKEITQANHVLNELRKEIKQSLRQTGKKEESREGIDMALCVIDTNKNLMQYSGAYSSLYLVSNNSGSPVLKEIKADKMPVGVHFSSDTSFTNHEIKLEIGDTFYMSTDGLIDQVGGSKNTRFGNENFKKLLMEIHDQPLYEQREILERKLKDWMGKYPQRDDILVIGARV